MKIIEILKKNRVSISFEFFPPKSEKGWDGLFDTISELQNLKPAYVSVTYGAGGSTRENTHKLIKRITDETDLTVVAHLTCIHSRRDEIKRIIASYQEAGIENILALRGDIAANLERVNEDGTDFQFASDLIDFIRKIAPDLCIGAACFPEGHPRTPNRLKEMEYLKEKVDAGVDYLVSQLFFDNRDFLDFCERARLQGINVPIIAGIMPLTSWQGMQRMADLAAGARFPASLLRAVNRGRESGLVTEVGVQWATEQVRNLIDQSVAGIHFYTLNHSQASIRICQSLGLRDYSAI
ncbi:MAG: methylenetetrahydrofolate reductase [NAD(P)H] [Spirochaetales bacterium]|nr:methylenetetrahydrofolate reductase [NAD(P)H] [Spirochaetales bacterium]